MSTGIEKKVFDVAPTPAQVERGLESWEPYNKDDPRSLLNICPKETREFIEQVPVDWLLLTETELSSFIELDPTVSRIRLAFWAEYEVAQLRMERMNIHRISQMLGMPARNILLHMRNSEKMAWILCVPTSYENYLEEAVSFGLKRLRDDLLTMNINDPAGNIDPKKAELLLKAVMFVEMRKSGGIVQKNLHLHHSTREMKKLGNELTLAEIDEKIKALEAQGGLKLAQDAVDKETTKMEAPLRQVDAELVK